MQPNTEVVVERAFKPTVWRLRGHLNGGGEHTFELAAGDYHVGSSPRSDLRLPSSGVSREHAVLTVNGRGLAVVDRDSKNGTFIDGRRVDRAGLSPGSVVAFGPVELFLEAIDEDDLQLAITLDVDLVARSEWGPGVESVSRDTLSCDPGTQRTLKLMFPQGYVPGTSPAMTTLYQQMETVARGDLPVLIVGETGVGKEGLVSILHASSRRHSGPLVTLNCAAIPADLFEAELFGIGKGVATGVDARPGKVRAAQGGTLFLDEIGEMPLTLQTKLLRVLQANEIQPLGAAAETVDIRVVAATNADLERRMACGTFRRDLYFRLAGSILEVPPLRDRRADIPALVEHFLRRAAQDTGTQLRGVTVKAMGCWMTYDWPGNVRELEHEVRRAVSRTADGGVIDTGKISTPQGGAGRRSLLQEEDEGAVESADDLCLETRLRALEERLIRQALRRTRGRQNHAAKLLRISRNGLARRLERLGIDYRIFR